MREAVFYQIFVFKLVPAYIDEVVVRTRPEAPRLMVEYHEVGLGSRPGLVLSLVLSRTKQSKSEVQQADTVWALQDLAVATRA